MSLRLSCRSCEPPSEWNSGWLPMGGMEPAATVVSDQQPAKSARIFEGGHCLDDFLRCTGKNDLAVALLQLADVDGDVMLADTEESAGAYDGVGDRFVRSDDDVVGLPDRLALVVVDVLPENLAPGAPSHGNVPQFSDCHAELRGAHNLLTLRRADRAEQHGTHGCRYRDASLHVFLLVGSDNPAIEWHGRWPIDLALPRSRRLYSIGIHACNDGFDGRPLSLVDRSSSNFHRCDGVVL